MANDPVLTRCLESGWRRVAFIGLTKHAGKTTALNAFIAAAEEADKSIGLCSIGLDGERLDTVLGVEKPAVYVPAGTIVASAERALEQTNAKLEWLEELPIPSPLGPVMLARVTAPGQVLLAGVRQRRHVELVMGRLADYHVDFSLVDGAFDRIAAAAPHLVDAAVVAIGATAAAMVGTSAPPATGPGGYGAASGNGAAGRIGTPGGTAVSGGNGAAGGNGIAGIVRLAAAFFRRFQLPEVSDEIRSVLKPAHDSGQIGIWDGEKLQLLPSHQTLLGLDLGSSAKLDTAPIQTVYVPGALTDGVCQQLTGIGQSETFQIVVAHQEQVLASEQTLKPLFRSGRQVTVWTPLPIVAVAVNPRSILGYDVSWEELASELARLAPNLLFYDALKGRTLNPSGGI